MSWLAALLTGEFALAVVVTSLGGAVTASVAPGFEPTPGSIGGLVGAASGQSLIALTKLPPAGFSASFGGGVAAGVVVSRLPGLR